MVEHEGKPLPETEPKAVANDWYRLTSSWLRGCALFALLVAVPLLLEQNTFVLLLLVLQGFFLIVPARRFIFAHTNSTVSSAPGSLVLKAAEFLCTKKVYERVFLQAILDMREEYNEALFKGRKEKARWVLIRGYLSLAWSVTLQVVEFLLSGPAKIIKSLWT